MFNNIAVFAFAATMLTFATPVSAQATRPRLDTSGRNMQPNYPASAMPNKERGEVLLDVVVAPGGTVEKVALVHSTGFNDLDSAAIDAVLNWHFVPAMKDDAPVEGTTTLALAFAPPGEESNLPKTPIERDYFPPDIVLSAPSEHYDEKSYDVPCSNGSISTEVLMERPAKGRAIAKYGVSVWMEFKDGDDWVITRAMLVDRFSNVWLQRFSMERWMGEKELSTYTFNAKTQFGRAIPLLVSWDQDGHVSMTAGIEKYSMQLPKPPKKFTLDTSGIDTHLRNTILACTKSARP